MGQIGSSLNQASDGLDDIQNNKFSDLSGREKAAKLGMGALKGFGNSQNQMPRFSSGGAPIQIAQTPQVQLPQPFQPNANGFQRGPNPNMFFGGGY